MADLAADEKLAISFTSNNATVTEKDGIYTFVMPAGDVLIKVQRQVKANKIDLASAASGLVTVQSNADSGETVAVLLTDTAKNSGKSYTITAHAINQAGETIETIAVTDGKFTMPQLPYVYRVEISVAEGDFKAYEIKAGQTTNGTIIAPARADAGEQIEIKLTPAARLPPEREHPCGNGCGERHNIRLQDHHGGCKR